MLGGAGGEGAFVLAFTMSLEYSGVAERVPGLPWVTYSTLLANMISGYFSCFLAALAALYLTLVSESVSQSVSDRHFRILTEIVTFET